MARFVRRACQPRFGGRHHPRSDDAFLALGVSDECRRGRATRSVDCLGVSVAPGVRQDFQRLVVETRHQRLCLSASRPSELNAVPSSAHRRRRAGARLRARARSRDRRAQDSRARQPPQLTRGRGGEEGGASLSPWLVPAADSRRLPTSCSRRRPGCGGRGPRVVTVEPDAGFEALRTIVEEGDTARIDAILDIFDFSEEIVTEADVETFVARRCHAEDAPTRRLAARAAGYLHDEAGAVTCLPKLLRDSDIAVARAAAMSIGRLRDESAFPLLVESLSRRPLRASVRKAIARFGTDKIESLAARFRDEAETHDVRVALPLVLAEFDDPRAVNALFAALPQDDRRLHYQGVKGLGKLRKRSPDLRFPRNEADRLLKGEASRLAALASLRSGITSITAVLESHLLVEPTRPRGTGRKGRRRRTSPRESAPKASRESRGPEAVHRRGRRCGSALMASGSNRHRRSSRCLRERARPSESACRRG